MGIPGLIASLEQYGTLTSLREEDVVIDGPGFVFHIYGLCASHIVGQPSYDTLGRAAIQWLDALRELGVAIRAIYFDGHLPISKRPTRLERLLQSGRILKSFHQKNPESCQAAYLLDSKSTPSILFPNQQFRPDGRRASSPLPSAFLVPAILEHLRLSPQYGSITHLVPAEAEVYCARDLSAHGGGVVLTGDSDLLVHDIGAGSVVFLKDMRYDHGSDEPRLFCRRFCPNELQMRLGVNSPDGLLRLAYEITVDPSVSVRQAAKRCSQPPRRPQIYADFVAPYRHPEAICHPSAEARRALIRGLDPRLSELVLQCAALGSPAGGPETMPAVQANGRAESDWTISFLPPLMDCPSFASSWLPSYSIRRLAYSLLAGLGPSPVSALFEQGRVQTCSGRGREVALLSGEDLTAATARLGQVFTELDSRLGDEQQALFWPVMSLHCDITASQDGTCASSLGLLVIRECLLSAPGLAVTIPWVIIHFVAILQGAMFSFRMLAQVVALASRGVFRGNASPNLSLLQKHLDRLPPLFEYPTLSSVRSLLRVDVASAIHAILAQLLDLPPAARKKESPRQSRRRKNVPSVASGRGRANKVASRNPFDALATTRNR